MQSGALLDKLRKPIKIVNNKDPDRKKKDKKLMRQDIASDDLNKKKFETEGDIVCIALGNNNNINNKNFYFELNNPQSINKTRKVLKSKNEAIYKLYVTSNKQSDILNYKEMVENTTIKNEKSMGGKKNKNFKYYYLAAATNSPNKQAQFLVDENIVIYSFVSLNKTNNKIDKHVYTFTFNKTEGSKEILGQYLNELNAKEADLNNEMIELVQGFNLPRVRNKYKQIAETYHQPKKRKTEQLTDKSNETPPLHPVAKKAPRKFTFFQQSATEGIVTFLPDDEQVNQEQKNDSESEMQAKSAKSIDNTEEIAPKKKDENTGKCYQNYSTFFNSVKELGTNTGSASSEKEFKFKSPR
ncbi:MAG: hypothetical protein JO149_09165 [Gammaproteobacteria bacterium]|nr:hypothetical protein [Gammaproteobacteria bacterium]